MNIYLWLNNRSESDFTKESNLSADHSAAIVIVAKDAKTAKTRAKEIWETAGEPVVLDIKEGLVVYADGDC